MRFVRLLSLALLVGALCSCATFKSLSRVEEVEKRVVQSETRIRHDMATFYADAAKVYDQIGYEYFNLALEMERAGRMEDKNFYGQLAKTFAKHAADMRERANLLKRAPIEEKTPNGDASAEKQP